MSSLAIVFAGTPEFSVPALEALLASKHRVQAVYTQPDRPAGRGRQVAMSAVKQTALRHSIPVEQPATLRDPAAVERLGTWAADVMVVVAYGLLLPQSVLDLPRYGAPIERHDLFPRRTNVSFWRRMGQGSIRTRIFERGVGETMSSGTGATGAAVAAVLRGVDSPVTVVLDGGELEVEVGKDLHVDLTGWARSVYEGKVSDELMAELHETE